VAIEPDGLGRETPRAYRRQHRVRIEGEELTGRLRDPLGKPPREPKQGGKGSEAVERAAAGLEAVGEGGGSLAQGDSVDLGLVAGRDPLRRPRPGQPRSARRPADPHEELGRLRLRKGR